MNEQTKYLPHYLISLIRSDNITYEQREALKEFWQVIPQHHVHGCIDIPKCEHPECIKVRAREKELAANRDFLAGQAMQQWHG